MCGLDGARLGANARLDRDANTAALQVELYGKGSVVRSPGGDSLGRGVTTHSRNSVIRLTAQPQAGYQSHGWVGVDTQSGRRATVQVENLAKVKAYFADIRPQQRMAEGLKARILAQVSAQAEGAHDGGGPGGGERGRKRGHAPAGHGAHLHADHHPSLFRSCTWEHTCAQSSALHPRAFPSTAWERGKSLCSIRAW